MSTVLDQYLKGLRAQSSVPELRVALAQDLRQRPSALADVTESRVLTQRSTVNTDGQISLASVGARPGFVAILDEVSVEYDNPANHTTIDGRSLALCFSGELISMFPPRTLANWMCDLFGPLKPHLIVPREASIDWILNWGSSTSNVEPADYDIYTRLVIRYEPKALCELLGLVNAKGQADEIPLRTT